MDILREPILGRKDVILAICANIILFFLNSFISFSNKSIQEWFGFILIVTFVLLIIDLCFLTWHRWKVVSAIFALFILLTFTPLALATIFVVMNLLPGNDIRSEMSSIELSDKSVVIYQNNCGATCAFGVDVAIERDYFFGLLKTQDFIHRYYPGDELVLEKVDSDSVRVVKANIDRTDRQLSKTIPTEGEVWDLSMY